MEESGPDPLRVLLVTPDYPPDTGGIQRLLHQITTHMPSAETRVVTMAADGATAFDAASEQRIHRLRSVSTRSVVRNAVFNAQLLPWRSRWKPDVLLNGHVVTSPAALLLARRLGVPNVLYTYAKELDGRPRLSAWAARRSDAVIAISEFTAAKVREVAPGLSTPVRIVTPGVEAPHHVVHVETERPTVVTIARLRDWYKGHDVLLDALTRVRADVPDVLWAVIGDGRLRTDLEDRVERSGLTDNVVFLGRATDEERDRWLARASVFAMPSRYPEGEVGGEGFGIVYLEAAVWGVPSLAGNVGAPTEVVEDGVTGRLVDPVDPAAVADALVQMLSEPEKTRAWGRAAQLRAREDYSWERVGSHLRSELAAVVAGGR
ncbi:glycosyltransferase family 4 protein [Nocardioides sp. CPCC 205120]|uniref:glycosyltransferase family 4 protein n=1 Tax=Nocardioides sp. CPCC 205120 TaxID=3406462 RepID=UPI003B508376